MSSAGGYGGSKPRPLYGVWIDEALKSNDVNQMKEALQEARKQYPGGGGGGGPIHALYASHIHHRIDGGASRDELQQLLEQAKATLSGDLQGAIKKLEQHLGKK